LNEQTFGETPFDFLVQARAEYRIVALTKRTRNGYSRYRPRGTLKEIRPISEHTVTTRMFQRNAPPDWRRNRNNVQASYTGHAPRNETQSATVGENGNDRVGCSKFSAVRIEQLAKKRRAITRTRFAREPVNGIRTNVFLHRLWGRGESTTGPLLSYAFKTYGRLRSSKLDPRIRRVRRSARPCINFHLSGNSLNIYVYHIRHGREQMLPGRDSRCTINNTISGTLRPAGLIDNNGRVI